MPQTDKSNQFSGKTRITISEKKENQNSLKIPSILLPKGREGIIIIGEKVTAIPLSSTSSLNVPTYFSTACSCFNRPFSISMGFTQRKNDSVFEGILCAIQLVSNKMERN